ncbi:MAG TPA: class I SAM-dependent methyltransferase [Candidatus Sulfopaludibacter sp.]|nr:class I SAM-dependent methyltransferase [Candidatus Sulfopaludibacter sp.]
MVFPSSSSKKEWSDSEHVLNYLNAADNIPHRKDGESVLLDILSTTTTTNANRILDIGTGDGRLIRLIKSHLPKIKELVALDVSPIMIKAVKDNFSNDPTVKVVEHDLEMPLPDMGYFDAIVSSFAIHHLKHERKYSLYKEIYDMLYPAGVFCNLEHVSSVSISQHEKFLKAINTSSKREDKTNRLLSVEKQLQWLRDFGFVEVDCYWKWLELALLVGYKI